MGHHSEGLEEDGSGMVRHLRDVRVYRNRAGRLLVHLEKRRTRLGIDGPFAPRGEVRACRQRRKGSAVMALAAAVTDLDQLKSHPAIARLVSWSAQAVEGAKFDR